VTQEEALHRVSKVRETMTKMEQIIKLRLIKNHNANNRKHLVSNSHKMEINKMQVMITNKMEINKMQAMITKKTNLKVGPTLKDLCLKIITLNVIKT